MYFVVFVCDIAKSRLDMKRCRQFPCTQPTIFNFRNVVVLFDEVSKSRFQSEVRLLFMRSSNMKIETQDFVRISTQPANLLFSNETNCVFVSLQQNQFQNMFGCPRVWCIHRICMHARSCSRFGSRCWPTWPDVEHQRSSALAGGSTLAGGRDAASCSPSALLGAGEGRFYVESRIIIICVEKTRLNIDILQARRGAARRDKSKKPNVYLKSF